MVEFALEKSIELRDAEPFGVRGLFIDRIVDEGVGCCEVGVASRGEDTASLRKALLASASAISH